MSNKSKPLVVVTNEVRLNFVILRPPPGESHSVCALISKTDKDTLKRLQESIDAAIEAGKSKWGNQVPKNLITPLKDGETKASKYPEFAGCMYLNAKTKYRPGTIGSDRQEILDLDDLYSGVYARISLNAYSYSALGNQGIGFGLNNILKTRDGPRFAGRDPIADFFDDETEAALA
jgi:hypothetical protein